MQAHSLREANTGEEAEYQILHRIYLYYLLGLILTGPLGPIIGFLHALKQRRYIATAFGRSHIVYQIKLFRRCAAGLVAGLSVALISARYIEVRALADLYAYISTAGLAFALICVIWFVAKCALGLSNANAGLGA